MDATRFDALSRALSTMPSRRGVARALVGGTLAGPLAGLFGLAASEAKKKHKHKKKKKCKGATKKCDKKCIPSANCCTAADCDAEETCEGGVCTPPPSTCSDDVQNGDETDVDCGGSCPRCANGKSCDGRDDCASAFCVNDICGSCNGSSQCGSDNEGNCVCEPLVGGSSACNSIAEIVAQPDSCEECAPGLNCLDLGSQVGCVKPCGAP